MLRIHQEHRVFDGSTGDLIGAGLFVNGLFSRANASHVDA